MGPESGLDVTYYLGDWCLNVITVECQVHGYRQGHQLLAGSMQLPRDDQSTVDRLSDVAGPLRPREIFEPYLTAYPLPSGSFYVLARTWQDPTVTRAGCVRTLSLIIPIADWAEAESLSPFLDLLELQRLPEETDAYRVSLQATPGKQLPPSTEFQGSELLEALFLEDVQPVVVFEAPRPELVATRLLTALWPAMRRLFAVSTFALSPRKVGGRDFDLVFAPKDAKSKFSDWIGRRVDGRSSQDARHRWTETIVHRVFDAPHPRLLPIGGAGVFSKGSESGDSAALLRIMLLWDELLVKLKTTPTAALGLLDIANSGKVSGTYALSALEPLLAEAVHRASVVLPEDEAWNFLGAIARKMQGRAIPGGDFAVHAAVEDLSGRAPEGAIALLSQPDDKGIAVGLLPIVAKGIGDSFTPRSQKALLTAPPELLGNLVGVSTALAGKVANDHELIVHIGEVLPLFDESLFSQLRQKLLPFLVMDWQFPAAQPLLQSLDNEQLTSELLHLGRVNDFAAPKMVDVCLRRARKIGVRREMLVPLLTLPDSEHRNNIIARSLEPSVVDVAWLLLDSGLSSDVTALILADLLRKASDDQLNAIVSDERLGEEALRTMRQIAPDLLQRIILEDAISLNVFAKVIYDLFAHAEAHEREKMCSRALERCLGKHFGGDEISFIAAMLGGVGEHLDSKWVAHLGLANQVDSSVVNRNIIAFHKAPQPAHSRIVSSIAEVAKLLRDRSAFDLDEEASDACAQMLFEAEEAFPSAALFSAGYLLPMLMRQRTAPVSLMIAATFPVIYRELAKKDEASDLLKFVPFFDWDRCKAARQELVDSFMSSSWLPGNLALTACRCSDVSRILRRTAKAYGGDTYLGRVSADLGRLPDGCRESVIKVINSIRANWPSKYDWHD